MSTMELGVRMFLQLAVILATCRVVGWLGRRFLGQTQVVMEMVAGVLLGPSLLGWLAPALQRDLFPDRVVLADGSAVAHPSMAILYALAQVGLVLYMFVIGLEFNPEHLRGKLRSAGLISASGIVVPFVLGGLLALAMLARRDLFTSAVTPFSAVLFIGSAMSITAFPMLARILYERGLANTRLGTVTLASGSIDDALAWCFLAVVIGTFNATPARAAVTIFGGLAYAVVMLWVGRPLLRRLERSFLAGGRLSEGAFTAVLLVLIGGAYFTDRIGIYAVFGAFIAGAAMPKGEFGRALTERIEVLTTSLFLPMFFVYSGLNTQLGLLNSPALWLLTGVVVLLAILGKGVACAMAARWSGESWRDAAIIGTLMNARGLMELILLNIGREHGLITPTLFTVLVMMAVVTTLMASPLYLLLIRTWRPPQAA